jgi:hypothetical protein
MKTSFTNLPFEEARARSNEKRKILFALVTAKGCVRSQQVRAAYEMPDALGSTGDQMIAVHVDRDDDPETAARLKIDRGTTPQVLFFSRGTEIHREDATARSRDAQLELLRAFAKGRTMQEIDDERERRERQAIARQTPNAHSEDWGAVAKEMKAFAFLRLRNRELGVAEDISQTLVLFLMENGYGLRTSEERRLRYRRNKVIKAVYRFRRMVARGEVIGVDLDFAIDPKLHPNSMKAWKDLKLKCLDDLETRSIDDPLAISLLRLTVIDGECLPKKHAKQLGVTDKQVEAAWKRIRRRTEAFRKDTGLGPEFFAGAFSWLAKVIERFFTRQADKDILRVLTIFEAIERNGDLPERPRHR